MPVFDADHVPFSIPCGNCGNTTEILFGRLKQKRQVVCAKCGQVTEVDSSEIEKTIDALNRSVSKKT